MGSLKINSDNILKLSSKYGEQCYEDLLKMKELDWDNPDRKMAILRTMVFLKENSMIQYVQNYIRRYCYELTDVGRERLNYLKRNKDAIPLEVAVESKPQEIKVTNSELAKPVKKDLSFVCYSRSDSDIALRLAKDVKNLGFNIWMDQINISAGDRWAREVEQALQKCDNVLLILSPAAIASDNVHDEITYALEERKRIIPIIVTECKLPLRLRSFQFIDLTKNYNDGFQKLSQEINERQYK